MNSEILNYMDYTVLIFFSNQWTLDLPHPLMSPEGLDELMGGTEVHLKGTRVSP